MEIKLSTALDAVRFAIGDVAQKAVKRRLTVYGNKIPCKSGCNGCCSRLVYISMAEAILIYEYLVENGSWQVVATAARKQFQLAQQTDPLAWFKMDIKCPILDQKNGTCLAYKMRPAKCSTHFVTSNPAVCDPWNPVGGRYESVDMVDLQMEFEKRLESAIDGHGIMQVLVPIPVAILLAERIQIQSGLSLQSAISLLYMEFSNKGDSHE